MRPPPFLIAASLLFWGWYAGLLIPAGLCGALLEMPRWTTQRLDFRDNDLRRLWIFCCLLLLGAMVFFLVEYNGIEMFSQTTLYSPLIFFPVVVAQAFHRQEALPIRVLMMKKEGEGVPRLGPESWSVNWLYLYLILIMISASAAAKGPAMFRGGFGDIASTLDFYLGSIVILGIALWKFRSPAYSPTIWLALIVLATGLGYVGSLGIQNVQVILDREIMAFMMKNYKQERDPFRTETAIGKIGELKLYSHILFRIQELKGSQKSFLLGQNGYTVFRSPNWLNPSDELKDLTPERDRLTWSFGRAGAEQQVLKIIEPFEDGHGFLPLPLGTFSIGPLPAGKVTRNRRGAVRVQDAPEWAQYLIRAGEGAPLQGPPTHADLSIPTSLQAALHPTLRKLQLDRVDPARVPGILAEHFENRFTYSLEQEPPPRERAPLDHFLNHSRAGHCEYFATAATLLLRMAGIPARYMVGYSVHEFSPLENRFLVRARNAHSWAIAWIGGRWVEVDVTPPSWKILEMERASSLEWVGDLWDRVKMLFVRLRWLKDEENNSQSALLWALLLLLMIPGWKILRGTRFGKLVGPDSAKKEVAHEFSKTAFHRIECFLETTEGKRRAGETYRMWLGRIADERKDPALIDGLEPLVCLHYNLRYDPESIAEEQEAKLAEEVDRWLEQHRQRETVSAGHSSSNS